MQGDVSPSSLQHIDLSLHGEPLGSEGVTAPPREGNCAAPGAAPSEAPGQRCQLPGDGTLVVSLRATLPWLSSTPGSAGTGLGMDVPESKASGVVPLVTDAASGLLSSAMNLPYVLQFLTAGGYSLSPGGKVLEVWRCVSCALH